VAKPAVGTCYWCFIVLSSGLLYLLLYYWNSNKTELQQSLGKMDRTVKSYRGCTKAMIKAGDEMMLMREICRICVEVRGHRMAWVAFAENDPQKTLRVESHWGDNIRFFESFETTWASTESRQRPAGISIRTGKPVIFQNLLTDPRYKHCQETAKRCGYASCISLPLQVDNHIFGALVIFDTKPNAFEDEEVVLLEELAGDLSYGIKTLRLQAGRKQEMEERLMLAAVTEQTSDGVITFNPEGIIQYLNPSFIKLCGVPASEGLGVSIHDFECSKRNPEFYQAVSKAFETDSVTAGRFINKDRDGREHDIDARIAPVFGASGEVVRYVVTVRDISQEVQLQRQLRQTQKMEALATVSGRMADDFNNILAIIMTNSELGLIEDQGDRSAQENLLRIHKAAIQGKKTVKQFIAINQGTVELEQPLKISTVVNASINLFRTTIPSTIQFKNDVTPGLGLITGNPTQIQRVITNLCMNAKDAMQTTGGLLEVSLSSMDIPPDRIYRYPDLRPGKHVKLIITDTGHGISREDLEHIFDPFYTTREEGRGLGLSIAYGIVKNHAGIIYVNSVVDVGTTVVILLPLIDQLGLQKEKSAIALDRA
jgi:PAS domain S-box-containing protein